MDAEVVNHTIPQCMAAGERRQVSVTMRNAGSTIAWEGPDRFMLYSKNSPLNLWAVTAVDLSAGESIAPGQTKTFTFNITAPTAPGIYDCNWQMSLFSQSGFVFFGQTLETAAGVGAGAACDYGQCIHGVCNAAGECVAGGNKADGTPCDDELFCTETDACLGGVCVGSGNSCAPLFCDEGAKRCVGCLSNSDCDDGNVCTDDTCNAAGICEHANNTAPCDDGNACTTADACSSGVCLGGSPLVCDDGDVCNGLETCDPTEGCQSGAPVECPDDGIFCNGTESCDEAAKACVSSGNPCPEGTLCNEANHSCDDLIECLTDEDCNDHIFCNGVDMCEGGVCIHEGDPCAYCDALGCVCNEAKKHCTGCEADDDCDGICNPGESAHDCSGSDNCPGAPNPGQEDSYPPGGNGIGNACDCEGDFDCDGNVDGMDAFLFKSDYGRNARVNPCSTASPCNGDFDCDGNVDGSDAFLFKTDFGRNLKNNPCPACVIGDWCGY